MEYTPETLRALALRPGASVPEADGSLTEYSSVPTDMLRAHADAWKAQLKAVKAREEVCEWREDAIDGCWNTTCGNAFVLNDGKPSDNEMRFCGYCGKHLVERAASEPLEEEGT